MSQASTEKPRYETNIVHEVSVAGRMIVDHHEIKLRCWQFDDVNNNTLGVVFSGEKKV